LTQPHYRAILELARRSPGGKRLSLPRGYFVRYEREHLILSRARQRGLSGMVRGTHPPAGTILTVPGKTQFAGQEIEARILRRDDVDAAELTGDKGPFIEYFDLDRVQLPVMVRTRQPGDRFQPLGMAGEKKVGKFLTTAKVSCDLRERIGILADRERIIWVYPVRISEQAKITDRTQRVLQLTIRDL
jgi:tRNA(Ile)-lysidine synthase